eukprot:1157780-Pelagomonas_calceolata.AAC.14
MLRPGGGRQALIGGAVRAVNRQPGKCDLCGLHYKVDPGSMSNGQAQLGTQGSRDAAPRSQGGEVCTFCVACREQQRTGMHSMLTERRIDIMSRTPRCLGAA